MTVTDVKASYSKEKLSEGIIVKKGKKNFKKVVLQLIGVLDWTLFVSINTFI